MLSKQVSHCHLEQRPGTRHHNHSSKKLILKGRRNEGRLFLISFLPSHFHVGVLNRRVEKVWIFFTEESLIAVVAVAVVGVGVVFERQSSFDIVFLFCGTEKPGYTETKMAKEEVKSASGEEVKLGDFVRLGRYTFLICILCELMILSQLGNQLYMMFTGKLLFPARVKTSRTITVTPPPFL